MWQRFTEEARRIVFFAQEEAQKFGEGYVSTEHLLLGLLRESDSTAAMMLAHLGIGAEEARQEVIKQLPRGDARPSQDMTLTPRAKRVIDLAYDAARHNDDNFIGSEHLLIGLAREADGLAGRVLYKLGGEETQLWAALSEVRGSGAAESKKATTNKDSAGSRFKSRRKSKEQDTAPGSKYGSNWRLTARPPVSDRIWDHFTYRAQIALLTANTYAIQESDGMITDAHLIWAILNDPKSLASRILASIGVQSVPLASAIHAAIPVGVISDDKFLPLHGSAMRVIDLAIQESHLLGDRIVGTEHLLLGSMFDSNSIPGNAIIRAGVSTESLREAAQKLRNNESTDEDEAELERIRSS